jgi:diguanylate cyclase (GGDEF)-like protein
VLLPPFYPLIAPFLLTAYRQWREPGKMTCQQVFGAAANGLAFAGTSFAFRAFPAAIAGASPGTASHIVTWAAALSVCGAAGIAVSNALVLAAVRASGRAVRLRETWSREALFADLAQLSFACVITLPVAINPLLLPATIPMVLMQRRFGMHAQLVQASRIDAKTGLLNAAAWQAEGRIEVARAIRTGSLLAVAMADIDHFKGINDRHGHLAGDRVLASIAAAMSALMREDDVTGRWGGEEFVILMPCTGGATAGQLAERLRERISQLWLADGRDKSLRVTVSIGVAMLHDGHSSLDGLLAAADDALYQAKRAGRDRVVVLKDRRQAPPAAPSDEEPAPPAADTSVGTSVGAATSTRCTSGHST